MVTGTQTDTVAASAERFLNEVRTKNQDFYGTDRGQGALKDLQQTFPHPWLYVGELLQNAVDAGAKHIRLAVDEASRSLVIEHDGLAFNEEHVEALCVRGMSKKGAGTVGFMGIGFKAVFQSFECVDVSSGPWRFGFRVSEVIGEYGDRQRHWLGCVLPEYSASIAPPSEGMTCRFFLHHRLDRLGPISDDVTKVLSPDLLVLALLARRGVQEVEWAGEHWNLAQTEEAVDAQTTRVVLTAHHNGNGGTRAWVLFSARYQPSRAAIARFLEHRQIQPRPEEREAVYAEAQRERTVEVFCPLDEHGVPQPPKHGQAYALLPTGVQVPLGLHVQADWLLVTSRREIMEVETNEWHREILAKLAGLVRAYLSWITTIPDVPEPQLTESYAVLPDWSETEGAFVTYLQDPGFRESLTAALGTLAFLPVRTASGLRFATPTNARLLPSVMRAFDDPRYLPWLLFGENILSTSVLGSRTLESLAELNLLQAFGVDDLVARWETSVVGAWRDQLGANGPDAHLRLLRSLASLDETPAWRDATLRCLPAADGGWIARASAVGLPPEWDAIPEQDPALRSLIEPYLVPSSQRLDWTFDRSLRRDTAAQQYLKDLPREKFDDVLRLWWEGLPEHPDDPTQTLVLDVTCWVLLKQKQRPGLVMRVLCEDGTLSPLSTAVLADPYATSARRRFFPNHPVISGRYLHHKPGFSDADWRSFFEAANKDLKGPLRLWRTAAELSWTKLRERLPEYDPPSTKSWAINTKYGPWSLYSKNYLLIDTTLPAELAAALDTPTRDAARAIGAWMHEARQAFAGNHQLQLAYVPYNSSSVWDPKLPYRASWVGVLQNAAWVVAVGGGGPYAPASVLARPDPARPDAPVADLSSELITILEQCGIAFGSDIPEVASIERLRREGPTAAPERLVELLEAAINDSEGSEEHRAELTTALDAPLLPVPESATLIDGATRIGMGRLVQRSARGADLGGWLLSTESATADLAADDAYARLLGLVASVREIPENPSWEQALSFLDWVWHKRPDAELVRRILPRAYRLITEGPNDGSREASWGAAREHAVVYTASRKWVSVNNDHLFLDDLGDDRLKGVITGLFLATPGHLGENTEEQHRVADLLGVQRLSSRLSIVAEFDHEQPLPAAWATALDEIMDLLASCAQEDDASSTPTTHPSIAYFARITKSLVDAGATTSSWRVYAARESERICIAGDPDDFAADLCRVLLQWAGLANRRDLDELAPVVTQLIGWLNRPEKFVPRLQTVRSQRGLVPIQEPPTETPPAPDGTTSPAEAGPEPPTPPTPASPPAPGVPPTPPAPATPPPTAGAGGPSQEPSEETPPPAEEPGATPPPASGGYTADDREHRLQAVRRRRAELEAQEKALLGVGPIPATDDNTTGDEKERSGEFRSDDAYRDAALDYERRAGRYAVAKSVTQAGHDIDSYDRPLDDPARRLVRRIEVKGHGCDWTDDETVEVSDTQFVHALIKKDDGLPLADEFDYWLYVVERQDDGTLRVVPIKNPAQRAAKFEFRAGTWRALAEDSPGSSPDLNG
jgi:hypothetical protein